MDCSQTHASARAILQARIMEWVATAPSTGSSRPRNRTCVSYRCCISRRVLNHQCQLGSPLSRGRLNNENRNMFKVSNKKKVIEVHQNDSAIPSNVMMAGLRRFKGAQMEKKKQHY